jgi:hypothetical protein
MLMTLLKIVAGLAVTGIVALVLLAVVWGISTSLRETRARKEGRDRD